jgi:hypothetical protein
MLSDDAHLYLTQDELSIWGSAQSRQHAVKNQRRIIHLENTIIARHNKLQGLVNIHGVTADGCILDPRFIKVAQKPVSCPLTHAAYTCLYAGWENGKISDDIFKSWHDKCFAGFLPDALKIKMAAAPKSWAWVKLPRIDVPQQGCFYYDETVAHTINDSSKGRMFNMRVNAIDQIVFGKWHPAIKEIELLLRGIHTTDSFYEAMKQYHAQCTLHLRDRQRIGFKLACDLIVGLKARVTPAQRRFVARWLVGCLFKGVEMFNIWIVLLLTDEDYVKLAVWMAQNNWDCLTHKSFGKIAKRLHNEVRSTRLLPPGLDVEVDNVLYLALSIGRYESFVEPDLESLGIRSQPEVELPKSAYWTPTHKQSMYEIIYKTIESEATRFTNGLPTSTPLLTKAREEFYHLGASGSVGSSYLREYLPHINMKEHTREKMNKTIALNELSEKQMKKLLNAETPLCTTIGFKYESFRVRMLLASGFDHWLQENLIIGVGDSTFFATDSEYAIQMSSLEEASDVLLRWVQTVKEDIVTDVDYADFNIAHLIPTLQKWWRALGANLPPDFRVARDFISVGELCRKLAFRMQKMYVDLGSVQPSEQQKRDYPALQNRIVECLFGLWTGWRTTMFFHCVLNKAYFNAAVDLSTFAGSVYTKKRVGDDGHNTVHSIYDGLRHACALNDADLELQPSKQFIGKGKNEFVRVTTSNDGIRASVIRAVTSLVSSDLQSPEIRRGIETLRGCYDSLSNVLRRVPKLEIRLNWWKPIVDYWRLLDVRSTLNDPSMKMMIPTACINSSASQGGLGLWLPTESWYVIPSKINFPKTDFVYPEINVRKHRCADDAGRFISNQLVGTDPQQASRIIDSAVAGAFTTLKKSDFIKINREMENYAWVRKWRNVRHRKEIHPLERATRVPQQLHTVVVKTLDYMQRSMIASVVDWSPNPISVIRDVLAAGVKGVVNLLPTLVRSIGADMTVEQKVRTFIAMLKPDKQRLVNSLVFKVGPANLWSLVNKTVFENADMVWCASPKMSAYHDHLAVELNKILTTDLIDTYVGSGKATLFDTWCSLGTVLRRGRLLIRY